MAGMERFPKYSREDNEFLGGISDKVKLSAKIDMLAKGDLGKAIDIDFDNESPALTVGYVLPLKTDNTKHLALFKDGSIFILKPDNRFPVHMPDEEEDLSKTDEDGGPFLKDDSDENEEDLASGYRSMFSPSEHSYTFGFSASEYNLDQALSIVIGSVRSNAKVVCENKTYESLPKLKEAFGQVMSVAKEAKKERESARRESVHNFVDALEEEVDDPDKKFYHPDEDPPFDSPPKE